VIFRGAGGGVDPHRQRPAGAEWRSRWPPVACWKRKRASIFRATPNSWPAISLGEYSALCAAGALSLSDAARLLRLRGSAMQAAGSGGRRRDGGAACVELDAAREIAAAAADATGAVCEVANDNGGGQVVLSGARAGVEKAMEIAKERGVKRAVLLPVSAPFHCALMQPAAEAMKDALADAAIARPRAPVVANVTAAPASEPEEIRRLLVEQVTGAVRWRESVAFMAGRA